MIKEEEKAIEIVAKYLNFNEICGTRNFKEALETVLSMLKEKDVLYRRALSDLIKADRENIQLKKQIDLMAEQLAGLTIWNNEKEEPLILGDKEEIKQYFKEIAERKSEEWKK